MRILVVAVLPMLLCGCSPVGETEAVHAVHSGEEAILTHAAWQSLPVAVDKGLAHELDRAAETNDRAAVKRLEGTGKVFEVAVNTPVRVTGQSYNERKVEIRGGPQSGKSGWVPFEWLKPTAAQR